MKGGAPVPQNSTPRPRRRTVLVLSLLAAAVAAGAILHALDIPHVSVSRDNGCVTIVIGTPNAPAAPLSLPETGDGPAAAASAVHVAALDITAEPLPPSVRSFYRLPRGVYVRAVDTETNSLLRPGDIITARNGSAVETPSQLEQPDTDSLTVYRRGAYEEIILPRK